MDLVSSYSAGSSGTMTQSFSSAYLYEEVSSDADEEQWTTWLAIIMAVMVVAGAVVFCVVRRRKSDSVVYFDDSKGIQSTELATNGMVDTMDIVEEDDVDGIVVEVEAHPMTAPMYQ